MVLRHSSISEAYSALGLEQGASLEAVKTSYKQLALRTHPDKNQNNPGATVQFQQISSAYNVLLKHLDTSTPPPMPHSFSPSHHHHPHSYSHNSPCDDDDGDDDDGFDSEDYYDSDEYYYEEEEENLDFFMFLFEEMLNGRANRFAGARFQSRPREQNMESEEQYQARIKKQREDQAAAAQRRKTQEEAWRVRRQMERENEARAGEKRRKQKAESKKAEAEALRKSAAELVRNRQQKFQTLRSAVFTAARRGDADMVRKAIWEDGVDAAGGEIRPGMEDFVQMKPKDPKQTLLHIAVVCGDAQLVEWLDRHNAEADERDSQHRTAFHVALQYGHVPIIRYFLDAYPPKDSDSKPVFHASAKNELSLLRLAWHSGEPEVVWLTLESGLADSKAALDTWKWICSAEDQAKKEFGSIGKRGLVFDEGKFEETKDLFISWGGFTPPLTLKRSSSQAPPIIRPTEVPPLQTGKKGKNRSQQYQMLTPPESPESPPTPHSVPNSMKPRHLPSSSKVSASKLNDCLPEARRRNGRGRGRGGNHGRGAASAHTRV